MKVNLRIFSLIAILLITSTALAFANDSKVSVIINNQPVTYSDETGYPFLDSKGRTQVPFRQTMTTFGCTVDWNKETQTAIAMKDGIKVEVPIGKAYILKDGVNVSNDTTAVIINGKTYLPIAIVLRSFGAEVEWDGNNHSVNAISYQTQFINPQDINKYEEFKDLWTVTQDEQMSKTTGTNYYFASINTNLSYEQVKTKLYTYGKTNLELYILQLASSYSNNNNVTMRFHYGLTENRNYQEYYAIRYDNKSKKLVAIYDYIFNN